MSLPVAADLKTYLRIQGTADDALVASLLAQSLAMAEAHLRRPITALERTFVLEQPSQAVTKAITVLHVPVYPIQADDTAGPYLTVTDADAVELVEGTDYRVDRLTGRITAEPDVVFDTWPYTVVATVGLSVREDYDLVVEPAVSQAIIDIAADLYQRRSPAASSETTGGGVSSSYVGGLPARAADALAPFRMARALG